MLVDVTGKTTFQLDLDGAEAFRILCKTLQMTCVLDEDLDGMLFTKLDDDGELRLYKGLSSCDCVKYDDRGELYAALFDLRAAMFGR